MNLNSLFGKGPAYAKADMERFSHPFLWTYIPVIIAFAVYSVLLGLVKYSGYIELSPDMLWIVEKVLLLAFSIIALVLLFKLNYWLGAQQRWGEAALVALSGFFVWSLIGVVLIGGMYFFGKKYAGDYKIGVKGDKK
ncbi:MAG: hypothetical protein Q8P05_05465 [Candidatus Diapherotrites archaeon]|nr:hypothetical protein [Candidatus Diapherotrites archaeon]